MAVDPRWLRSKIPEAAVFTPLSGINDSADNTLPFAG